MAHLGVFFPAVGSFLLLSASAYSQDYSKFARCNEADKQATEAKDSLKRADRERLLYDLYIDLMSLFRENSKPASSLPTSLRKSCIKTKWEAYSTAYKNADPSFASTFKLKWQTAELEEAYDLPEAALKSYMDAAKLEPNNAEVQMKFFKIWDTHKRKSLNVKNQEINSEDMRQFVAESETRLKQIASMRDAPREVKAEATIALCDLYRELKKIFTNPDKLVSCYETLLTIEPNNEKALRSLADYYINKGLKTQASPYLARLQGLGAASVNDLSITAQVMLDQRNYSGLLSLAETELEKSPRSKTALENKAIALQGLGKKIELAETIQLIRKVNPASDFLHEVDAIKLESSGDEFSNKGLPSNALASYQSATKLLGPESHNLYRIQRKIALIIFEHHKAENFENKEAAEVDMKEVTRLLVPVLKEKNPDPEILRIGVKASMLAKRFDAGEDFCERLFGEFSSLNNKPELLDCADILISAGKRAKAGMLLDQAAKKPQYPRDVIDAEKHRRRL